MALGRSILHFSIPATSEADLLNFIEEIMLKSFKKRFFGLKKPKSSKYSLHMYLI